MKAADIVIGGQGARFLGRRFACSLGQHGVTQRKREGDGASPVGTHRIVGCLYRPDRLAKPCDWAMPIRPFDLWCDDPRAENYNHMARAPFDHSHEVLFRADPLYDLVLLTDWNWPYAVPGRGSAIFLHTWRKPRHPTEGCAAFHRQDLLWITGRIRHETRIIIQP